MSSNPPRTADQCRILYVSSELPSLNRSDWPPDEFERLKTIVEAHNRSSAEPVEDVDGGREKLRVDWVEIAQELGVSWNFLVCFSFATYPPTVSKTNRTALQCLRKFVLEPTLSSKNKTVAKSTRRRATSPGSSKPKANARDKILTNAWSEEEDQHLREGIQRHGIGNWPEGQHSVRCDTHADRPLYAVALHVNAAMSGTLGHVARTPNQCGFRYTKSLCPTIKKGKWSQEEDEALQRGVAAFGRTWTK